jgi:hypothetical protein
MSTALLESPTTADAVRDWRRECLIRAGYPRADARRLSERRDVDLHLAVQLLERGCRVDTALRILL